jgi:hypothetical protein
MNKAQLVTFRGTEIQKLFWKMFDDSMKEKLSAKMHVYESMIPDYPPGFRRLTPGRGYLEALVQDNVEFVGTGISQVDETELWAWMESITKLMPPYTPCHHMRHWG